MCITERGCSRELHREGLQCAVRRLAAGFPEKLTMCCTQKVNSILRRLSCYCKEDASSLL